MKLLLLIFFSCILHRSFASNPQVSKKSGGKPASPDQYRWMVTVTVENPKKPNSFIPICGGSLIQLDGDKKQSDIVLTAAHCIIEPNKFGKLTKKYRDEKTMRFVLGNYLDNEKEPGEETRHVKHMEYHPHWDPSVGAYDLALIKLDSPVSFSKTIKPIPLPKNGHVLKGGTKCTIAGWGETTANKYPNELYHMNVTVQDSKYCKDKWSDHKGKVAFETTYCIEPDGHKRGPTSCPGDSGGPMFCQEKGQMVIHGVTSLGSGTCDGLRSEKEDDIPRPALYAKVELGISWITGKIHEWKKTL